MNRVAYLVDISPLVNMHGLLTDVLVLDNPAYGGVKRPRTPYNSQPSRLQISRHVYKTTVTSTIHSRHVYNSQLVL